VSAQRELRKNYLSIFEVLALSVSIIAPTMAMAFNTAAAAGAAGTAVPLAFLVSTIAMLLVGVSFVEFSKRISHSGSVYAYNARGLGAKTGFVSGWALMLTYFCYAAGCAALFGSFANALFLHFSIHIPTWIFVAIGIAAVWSFAFRDVKLSTRAALILELLSVVVILVLAFVILGKGGAAGITATPLTLKSSSISGVGMAMVFGVLSFAGFEGAATLGEEAKNPRRAVPLSIFGTVILAGIFFVFVSFAEVNGFGVSNIAKLASSSAPLDTLSTSYVGNVMAVFVDFAAMISAFACSLGSASACSRMLFAMGRDGALPLALGKTHEKHKTPHVAVHAIGIGMIVLYVLWGLRAGEGNFYSYVGTIGTLTLLVAYLLINVSALRYFRREKDKGYSVLKHAIIPVVSFLILLWPIWNNIYPVPQYPFNLFPYVALAWLVVGVVMISIKTKRDPEIARRIVSDL